ncbi:antitoxin Xre/MbcA/ParS toxin-binding domain-containing protein [Shewanella frigidimarina]|uniref:antitoxin Xre/MbcA/ParS toxin-binding domain-containing protein n=1 Tax=Shewanella frigidimarina TaxID=56812 RepID=UPI003D7943B9
MSDINDLQELLKNHTDLFEELMGVFHNNEKQALSWLTHPKVPLCNLTPISLITDKVGKEKVIDMLYRIKSGDMS